MSGETAQLLVVDDQPGVLRMICEVLRESGYQVDQATNGNQALSLVRKKKYHLVILDVRMPGLSGIETLREMRKIDPGVPVILMTAYEELDDMEEANRLGVVNYLRKPFDLNELRTMAGQHSLSSTRTMAVSQSS